MEEFIIEVYDGWYLYKISECSFQLTNCPIKALRVNSDDYNRIVNIDKFKSKRIGVYDSCHSLYCFENKRLVPFVDKWDGDVYIIKDFIDSCFFSQQISKCRAIFYRNMNDKLHNVSGPAAIYYNFLKSKIDSTKQQVVFEEYRINGKLNRRDGPAVIHYCNEIISREIYYKNNTKHRDGFPADIMWTTKRRSNDIIFKNYECYYMNGGKHRKDEPCEIYYGFNDEVIGVNYYLKNKLINRVKVDSVIVGDHKDDDHRRFISIRYKDSGKDCWCGSEYGRFSEQYTYIDGCRSITYFNYRYNNIIAPDYIVSDEDWVKYLKLQIYK